MGLIVQKGVPYPNPEYTIHELTDVDDSNKSDGSSLVYNAANSKYESKVITKSLTWAEYQSLSEEEKNNGTAYFITDVNGDGQNFQPVIYSEEEREIGVWTDGKPLYEKTIVANVTQNQFSIDVSDLHIDNIVVNDGFIVQTIGNVVYIPYSSNYNDYAFAYYNNNNNYIKCSYAGSYNTTTWNIRIRYTKTTDAAGSGTWTPQGVPAHHYSTSEQIVGKWIDGKPLYERTISVTSGVVSTGTRTTISSPSLTNCNVKSIDGHALRTVPNLGNIIYKINTFEDNNYFVNVFFDDYVGTLAYQCKTASGGGSFTELYITIRYTKSS